MQSNPACSKSTIKTDNHTISCNNTFISNIVQNHIFTQFKVNYYNFKETMSVMSIQSVL